MKSGSTTHSSWSPDGKRVVFEWSETNDAIGQLYVQNVDSTDPAERLPGQDPERRFASPDWSPDGKTIIFCSVP